MSHSTKNHHSTQPANDNSATETDSAQSPARGTHSTKKLALIGSGSASIAAAVVLGITSGFGGIGKPIEPPSERSNASAVSVSSTDSLVAGGRGLRLRRRATPAAAGLPVDERTSFQRSIDQFNEHTNSRTACQIPDTSRLPQGAAETDSIITVPAADRPVRLRSLVRSRSAVPCRPERHAVTATDRRSKPLLRHLSRGDKLHNMRSLPPRTDKPLAPGPVDIRPQSTTRGFRILAIPHKHRRADRHGPAALGQSRRDRLEGE